MKRALAWGVAALVLGLGWSASVVAQVPSACVASSGATFSVDTRISPRAGGACLIVATVYEGATCEAPRRAWSVELGCSEAHRLRVADSGRLVSILAPRTGNPLWPIVRIFAPDGTGVRRTSLRLAELPGTSELRGVVRMRFEGADVVMTSEDVSVTLALSAIEALAHEP